MTRIPSSSDNAPPPAGPYSPAIRVGREVFASGQAGFTPDGELLPGITSQTRQTLANLLAVLDAAGATELDVVRVGVFLTDVADFAAMNEVYASVFSEPWPARTTVYVDLPPGMLVEIDAIAVTDTEAGA